MRGAAGPCSVQAPTEPGARARAFPGRAGDAQAAAFWVASLALHAGNEFPFPQSPVGVTLDASVSGPGLGRPLTLPRGARPEGGGWGTLRVGTPGWGTGSGFPSNRHIVLGVSQE